ncbi:PREDICTED: uncharacterized protein LOC109210357 [Nicotiana attenuata]|uniref:uncharacterized protein LOC109210357 n=1 Tax=Nicotiana attenuata TaxID=49451 RepID=UPI000904DD09|nr:PREDICTED: uncharacterized protein LOC109210357 [Nicotiana attenuata]
MKNGLQCFFRENELTLSKIDDILLSRVCSETADGLPRSDEAASASSMKFNYIYVPIVDTVINISDVLLRPCCSKVCDSVKEAVLNPGELLVVYICELPEIKGKFDPVKAAKFKVEPGPKYAEIFSVLRLQGNVVLVHPCQVMEPSIPGPIVLLLVDCSTLSHLQELSSLESLIPYYLNTSEQPIEMCKKVNCLIHLSHTYVTNTTAYEQWTTKFGEAQRIMAGHEPKNIEIPILNSSSRVVAKLNYLCPQVFPTPDFCPLSSCRAYHQSQSSGGSCLFQLHLNLLPYKDLGLENSGVPATISQTEIIDEH